jgi:hypothetical protein
LGVSAYSVNNVTGGAKLLSGGNMLGLMSDLLESVEVPGAEPKLEYEIGILGDHLYGMRVLSASDLVLDFTNLVPPDLQLTWPTNAVDAVLQSTTRLGGAWTDVPTGSSTVTVSADKPQEFFRLKSTAAPAVNDRFPTATGAIQVRRSSWPVIVPRRIPATP